MVPSLLGLAVLLAGLVMIHYGLVGTLLPLTPIQPPASVGTSGASAPSGAGTR